MVATMEGVNSELMPWVRMTVPGAPGQTRIDDQSPGQPAFDSWLLLGGVVPFDRHSFVFLEVEPGSHFVEDSSSWLQRHWRHERILVEDGSGCRISDTVSFEPRLKLLGPLARLVVAGLFAHRHRRLRARYGA